MINLAEIDPIWDFGVGAMPASKFEKWAYETEHLERLLGPDLYLDVLSTRYSSKSEVRSLRDRFLVWLDGYVETEIDKDQRKARTQIRWAARRILEGRVGLAEGARVISNNYWTLYPEGDHWTEFSVFIALDSETAELPTEGNRRYWNEAAWQEKNAELKRYEDHYRETVLSACKQLLDI